MANAQFLSDQGADLHAANYQASRALVTPERLRSFFAPKSAGSLRRRVALYKLLTRGPLAKVLDKLATQAATAIKLKDYPEPARAA